MDDKLPHLEPAPEQTAFEYGMAVARVGAIAFPFLGSGVVLFDLITTPLRGKRLSAWCEQLRICINELSARVDGLTPAKLAAREEFNSAFARAAQAAMKTHQQEKLNALRDAVLNVALGKEPESTRQERFLSLVDQFTTQHLRLLRLFDDPSGYFAARGKSMPALPPQGNMLASQLVSLAMPDLAEQMKSSFEERSASLFQFIELLISDLVAAKLITLHRLNETWNVPRFLGPRSTEIGPMATHLGNDFLAFITCEEIKGIG